MLLLQLEPPPRPASCWVHAYAGRMDNIGEAGHLERLCLVLEWGWVGE